jgi:hypothetical protein
MSWNARMLHQGSCHKDDASRVHTPQGHFSEIFS